MRWLSRGNRTRDCLVLTWRRRERKVTRPGRRAGGSPKRCGRERDERGENVRGCVCLTLTADELLPLTPLRRSLFLWQTSPCAAICGISQCFLSAVVCLLSAWWCPSLLWSVAGFTCCLNTHLHTVPVWTVNRGTIPRLAVSHGMINTRFPPPLKLSCRKFAEFSNQFSAHD